MSFYFGTIKQILLLEEAGADIVRVSCPDEDSVKSLKKILEEAWLIENKNICEQNRGYTIYYPGNKNFGCSVHGNFGGISKNKLIWSNTNLKKHIYTSVYEYNKNSFYEMVFNNPTAKTISIKILLNNSKEKFIFNASF